MALNPEVVPSHDTTGLLQGVGRHEFKYVVTREVVEGVREYVRHFCQPDPHGTGSPPRYEVTTLQLDTPYHDLALAREREAPNRFKLRIRTYTPWNANEAKLEIKHKVNERYFKHKARVNPFDFDPGNLLDSTIPPPPLRAEDVHAYLNFARLVRTLAARPAMLIRYRRESYNSMIDDYARVTIDSRLLYAPIRSWSLDTSEIRWRHLDSAAGLRNVSGGYILEVKVLDRFPSWMADLIERFELDRVGFCKYSAALRLESLYQGFQYSDASENCTY